MLILRICLVGFRPCRNNQWKGIALRNSRFLATGRSIATGFYPSLKTLGPTLTTVVHSSSYDWKVGVHSSQRVGMVTNILLEMGS
jgi:hypothetical protein